MDKAEFSQLLKKGAAQLGLALPDPALDPLFWLMEELLRWNRKVNLTAITRPAEVVEKHLLDSLAILPEVEGARSLLDIGAGAGFPGLPLKLAYPAVQLTLLESQAKKVGFLKHAIAGLGLRGASARQLRAQGQPELEGLPPFDRVVSRALSEPSRWLPLARPYCGPGGRVLAMFGRGWGEGELLALGEKGGLSLFSLRRFQLPFSGEERGVAAFHVEPAAVAER